MALAYRAELIKRQEAVKALLLALEQVNRQLISFDSPATLALLDAAVKDLAAGGGDDAVKELDERFTQWGESWHADVPMTFEPDELVKAADAAKILHCSNKTMSTLRIGGRIKGHWDPTLGSTGGWRYKVADVYELSTKVRGRTGGWREKESGVTLNGSGSSDTK